MTPSTTSDESATPVRHVTRVREAVATLGWGTMAYRCEDCGFEWDIWLSLGVEGPPSLRESGLYAASPFTLSSCPAWPVNPAATEAERAMFLHLKPCASRMSHVRFDDDRVFAPSPIPDACPRFVLDAWHDTAALVIPEPALIAARRFHSGGSR
jgi:hypothetical protein